jgi:hypothetical protein
MSFLSTSSVPIPNLPDRIFATDNRDFRDKFNQKSLSDVFAKAKPDVKSDVTFSGISRFKQLFKKLLSK